MRDTLPGGEFELAMEEWDDLSVTVDEIAYVFKPLLVRRHELLAEVMRRREDLSPHAFDEYLVSDGTREFGPLWKNFGRGFRIPEVELWRDG